MSGLKADENEKGLAFPEMAKMQVNFPLAKEALVRRTKMDNIK